MLPLSGTLVITLEHAIAAPFCTRQLADLGARVIKVERPGTGDFARGYDERVHGLASHFVWTNRSKESLTLDVKHPEAAAILAALTSRADVLVQNLAPGAAARLGLSQETLSAHNPRLIVCDISGYGADGPYRDKKAYDLLIQSESGFLSVTGSADEPAKAGCSIADIAAGMYAYSSILAALIERATTGRGKAIDVSMLESMTQALAELTPAGWLERLAQLAVRQGVHLSTLQQKDGRDLELIFASATLHLPADRLLDERAANEVLRDFLAGAGVMLATDHVELRRWMVDTGFMPTMNGVELGQRALDLRHDLRVIYLTGYSEEAIAKGSFLHGEVVLKPWSVQDLQAAINRSVLH